MNNPALAVLGAEDFWFAVPLIISVSLVYAATRHEMVNEILAHAFRIGVWIVGFMAAVFVVLQMIAWLV